MKISLDYQPKGLRPNTDLKGENRPGGDLHFIYRVLENRVTDGPYRPFFRGGKQVRRLTLHLVLVSTEQIDCQFTRPLNHHERDKEIWIIVCFLLFARTYTRTIGRGEEFTNAESLACPDEVEITWDCRSLQAV